MDKQAVRERLRPLLLEYARDWAYLGESYRGTGRVPFSYVIEDKILNLIEDIETVVWGKGQ